MIEILLLLLVILMVGLNRKTSTRVTALETELEAIKADLLARQPVLAAAPAALPVAAAAAVTEAVIEEPVPEAEAVSAEAFPEETIAASTAAEDIAAAEEAPAPAMAAARPTAKPKTKENLESYLGARWPVWVGGVALAFGGIFLVRASIEAGLLGPGARLVLACLFGLLLMAGGEIVRRRAMPQVSDRFSNAMIPGALTAAGAVTLLGAIYAAYGVYEFIGATPAFVLLALVSFATIGLSLLHGQALAGLGLLASLLTPGLVASGEPNANALFLFLGLTWVAVNAASRFRQWTIVPMLANIGIGLWVIAYAIGADDFDTMPPTLTLIVMIASTGFFWPGAVYSRDRVVKTGWGGMLGRQPLTITLSVAIMSVLPALAMLATNPVTGIDPFFPSAAVIAALAALGASRAYAVWPAMIAAGGAVLSLAIVAISLLDTYVPQPVGNEPLPVTTYTTEIAVSLLLGAVFTLLGFAFLKRFRKAEPEFSMVWSVLMSGVPVALATISFLNFGNLGRDWTHGLYGVGLGLVLLAGAEWLFRERDETDGRIDWAANFLIAGSFAGFTFALHALTNGIVTTILLSVLGFAYVLGMRARPWPALPWMMAAAILIVFGRIAWEPTLIGQNSLGTTPFFNALLPGYGIPTLLAIVTAYLLKDSADFRIRNLMQALASLAGLMTVAVLVRHAMNGGVLDDRVPTLGEQSIYTLLTVGFSGILMTLDLKSPSPVFRWGSMIAGVLATINALSLHVFALNPYFSGENTGAWPFLNLLLLGYLLPGLAYALVAYYARGRRPMPYVVMLALAGAVLGFLWATLSVRRFWQGENIADWKGFLQGETYTYSVVWLLIGVLLLVIGSKLDAKSLRLASAALVLVAVVKVFLVDMSNLEGILRALSFIGLGAVLIGIGLFYQRILVNKGGEPAATDSQEPAS
ncbi:Putative membrane protein [Neorhizobium galegae bv. orientalis]|nr:Putative membrane protein [Neorhizobium galegae bv. orientalis]